MLSFVVLVLVHVLYIFTVFHFIPFVDSSSPLGIFPFFFLSFTHFLFFPPKTCGALHRSLTILSSNFLAPHFSVTLPFVSGTLAPSFDSSTVYGKVRGWMVNGYFPLLIHPIFFCRDNSLAIHHTLSSVSLDAYYASTHSPCLLLWQYDIATIFSTRLDTILHTLVHPASTLPR